MGDEDKQFNITGFQLLQLLQVYINIKPFIKFY